VNFPQQQAIWWGGGGLVGILLCFRRCGCKSPLAAAAATAPGEQRHQQDGRKHELSNRSDGKGGPGGA